MPELRLLFCSDPINPREPDTAFAKEVEAARACGLKLCLIDHDALDRSHDAAKAIRRIRENGHLNAVYRGWMLRASDYSLLYDALAAAGIVLVNTPDHYALCHHAPQSYPFVASWSAATTWINQTDIHDPSAIFAALAVLGAKSVVLKDWVKSQAAGYWDEACVIPDVSNRDSVMRVVSRFLELQSESLTGGLVFREYVPLVQIDGQIQEWRSFSLDGISLGCWPRLSTAGGTPPPDELVRAVARSLPARFAVADFAQSQSGRWLVIEIGEAQVSAVPDRAPLSEIFRELAATLASE
jgi:hypothetical protein